MKIKQTLRKGTNLSLIVAIFITGFTPLNAGGFLGGQEADYGTYGATYTGKVGPASANGINYAVGGKYQLKMAPNNPKPWFNVQAPEATLGCAGLSIKGMFGSLLNLDQIGEQLKDGGAAFAWGLILGLVTSLPSIKEVFDTINKWAAQIQALLADMCNLGKNLAKASGVGMDFDAGFTKLTNGLFKTKEGVKEQQTSTGENTTIASRMVAAVGEWASGGNVTIDQKQAMVFDVLRGLFSRPGSIVNSMNVFVRQANAPIYDYVTGVVQVPNTEKDMKFYKAGDVTIKVSPNGLTSGQLGAWQFKMMSALIVTNYIGHVGISSPHFESSNTTFKTLIDGINGSAPMPEAQYKTVLDGFMNDFRDTDSGKIFINGKLDEGAISDWLEKGTFPADKIYMPKIFGVQSNGKATGKPIVLLTSASDQMELLVPNRDWGEVIEKFGNVQELSTKQIDCITNYVTPPADCKTLPAITIPGASKYMQIYSQASTNDQRDLRELMISVNTKLWYAAILNEIDISAKAIAADANTGSSASGAPGGDASASAQKLNPIATGYKQENIDSKLEKVRTLVENLKKKFILEDGNIQEKMRIDAIFETYGRKKAQETMSGSKRN